MDKKTIGVIALFFVLIIGVFNIGGNNNKSTTNKSSANTKVASVESSSDKSSSSSISHIQETLTSLNKWYLEDYKKTVYTDYSSNNSPTLEKNFKKVCL